ncbi:MAG: type 4a pilus biogenesis protein PilO [Chitinivibrionales bacterium]|nr:type 4a pilus biogenesis protein PilO [Chitinivibrionales bacterium]MBD3357914.1 type 4a pilus biogenesis protein PilO [Chitinivibrionales bacterium]
MKKDWIMLAVVGAAFLGALAGDRFLLSGYGRSFEQLQRQWITTANKLATAKILHENLNHVRELVFENMAFDEKGGSVPHQQRFFEFLTTCVNDLKMELTAVEPLRPQTKGRIVTYAYNVELVGDFFSLGELCAKLENSRRIFTLETFEVRSAEKGGAASIRKGNDLLVTMKINTYRVNK